MPAARSAWHADLNEHPGMGGRAEMGAEELSVGYAEHGDTEWLAEREWRSRLRPCTDRYPRLLGAEW